MWFIFFGSTFELTQVSVFPANELIVHYSMKSRSLDDNSYVLFISVFWEPDTQCMLNSFFSAFAIRCYGYQVIHVPKKSNVKGLPPLLLMIIQVNNHDFINSTFTIILSSYNRYYIADYKSIWALFFKLPKYIGGFYTVSGKKLNTYLQPVSLCLTHRKYF